MKTTLMPLSFSRLSTFEQCESKFEFLYVTKRVQDQDNQYTIYGNRIHEALEQRGKANTGTPQEQGEAELKGYPAEAEKWLPLVDKLCAKSGTKYFEHQMAINRDRVPTDWFGADVWIRSIADVLIVDGDTAHCLDWKTGKVKDNPTQLQLFSAMVFAHFPDVQRVVTSYVWLAHDEITTATYQRSKVEHIWNALTPRFDKVQDAVDIGVFRSTPSGLCRFCPARDLCGDARK